MTDNAEEAKRQKEIFEKLKLDLLEFSDLIDQLIQKEEKQSHEHKKN